jgi:lysozyme family protein
MTSNFLKALTFTLKWEGGFTANPDDPGNWTGGNVGVGELKGTKWGISAASFPSLDIENLTIQEAASIYHEQYWEAISGDSRPYPEALVVFDFAVNSGVSRALAWWERGPNVRDYLAARLEFLASLSTFNTFGRGWVRRVNDLTRHINELDKNPDVELVQFYVKDREFNFYPTKTTLGTTNQGRIKVMARLV